MVVELHSQKSPINLYPYILYYLLDIPLYLIFAFNDDNTTLQFP